MEYPIFLFVESINTLYKITNDHSFTEIKTLGKYYMINEVSDDILPMRIHISDLLESEVSLVISEEKFAEKLAEIESEKEFREG